MTVLAFTPRRRPHRLARALTVAHALFPKTAQIIEQNDQRRIRALMLTLSSDANPLRYSELCRARSIAHVMRASTSTRSEVGTTSGQGQARDRVKPPSAFSPPEAPETTEPSIYPVSSPTNTAACAIENTVEPAS